MSINPVFDDGLPNIFGPTPITPVEPTPTVVDPGAGGTAPAYGMPRIIYNGKAIDLPAPPYKWQPYPTPARVVNTSPVGNIDTVLFPRMDSRYRGSWRLITSAELRRRLTNWAQWCLQGNPSSLTLDNTRLVDTRLTQEADADTLEVAAASGIFEGEIYKLVYGYLHELVTIQAINGTTLTLTQSVLEPFPIGATLRDQNYFSVSMRPDSSIKIEDVTAFDYQPLPQTRFTLEVDFYEDAQSVIEPWTPGPPFLLYQSGDVIELEDGSGVLELVSA